MAKRDSEASSFSPSPLAGEAPSHSPSPLAGEGWGGGDAAPEPAATDVARPSPPPQPLPRKGGGARTGLPDVAETRDSAGRLLCRAPLRDGRPHGEMRAFTADGLSVRMDWRDGTLDGTLASQGPAGRSEMSFVRGVAQGPMTLRDAQGRLSATASLEGGKLHGPMTLYDAAGKPQRRLHYQAGTLLREEPLTLAGRVKQWIKGP